MIKYFISILLFCCYSLIIKGQGVQAKNLLNDDDFAFLKALNKDVMESSRIYPHQKVSADLVETIQAEH